MEKRFLSFATGIFLLSVAALTYEVALSYEFGFMFWFSSSIAVLSIAMFGLGVGGVAGYFLSEKAPQNYFGIMFYSSLAFGIFIFLSLFLMALGSRLALGGAFFSAILLLFLCSAFHIRRNSSEHGLELPERE